MGTLSLVFGVLTTTGGGVAWGCDVNNNNRCISILQNTTSAQSPPPPETSVPATAAQSRVQDFGQADGQLQYQSPSTISSDKFNLGSGGIPAMNLGVKATEIKASNNNNDVGLNSPPTTEDAEKDKAKQSQSEINEAVREHKGEPCPHGEAILEGGKWGCKDTQDFLDMSNTMSNVTTAVGNAATQVAGQTAQQNTQAASQTGGAQSTAMTGAQKTADTAAAKDGISGLLNVVIGGMALGESSKRNKMAKQLKNESAADKIGPDGTVTKPTGNWELTEKTPTTPIQYIKNGKTEVSGDIMTTFGTSLRADEAQTAMRQAATLGSAASAEHKKMADKAKQFGALKLAQGAGQLVSAMFEKKAADQLGQAAQALNSAQASAIQPPTFSMGTASAAGAPQTISGSGLMPSSGSSAATAAQKTGGELGPPVLTSAPNNGLGAAPSPGAFTTGLPPAAGGGNSGSFSPSGGTSAANGGDSEPTAKSYDPTTRTGYTGAGSMPAGGGGKGGAGGPDGPDLSGLLAKFLPQKEDEAAKSTVVDLTNRNLAGEYSLLGRDTNIFQRIHDTYQDKNRRGHI